MREGVPNQLGGVPARKDQENDAIPKIAPKWLKYDRQVSPKSQILKPVMKGHQGFIFKTT